MFFSIVIPVYNAEKTLDRCLNSVLEQEFDDFEVIIINDGSSDNSSLICRQYVDKDRRFKYIEQTNKGVSETRNIGINIAEGNYLCFLDSDDVYYKNYLSAFYEIIYRYPDVGSYWCKYDSLNMNEEYKKEAKILKSLGKVSFWNRNTIMTLHEMALDGAPWNKIYQREIIIKNGICFNKDVSLGEDMMFNYDYLDKVKESIVLLDEPLYGYYCGKVDSLNCKYRNDLYDIYNNLDSHILKYLKKWNVFEEQKSKYYNSVFCRQEKILRNTYKNENYSTNFQKYMCNMRIIKTKKFKDAIKHSDCYIHPLYKMAYFFGAYWIVGVLNVMVRAKKILGFRDKSS